MDTLVESRVFVWAWLELGGSFLKVSVLWVVAADEVDHPTRTNRSLVEAQRLVYSQNQNLQRQPCHLLTEYKDGESSSGLKGRTNSNVSERLSFQSKDLMNPKTS